MGIHDIGIPGKIKKGITTFTGLTDTPTSYSGESGQVISVNGGETALEFSNAGSTTFTGLTDTPANYTGKAGNTVSVNTAETALEFINFAYPTGFENRTDSSISFNNVNLTFTVAPAASAVSFDLWEVGVKYTISASTDIIISNTEGIHLIYFSDGVLAETVNPTNAQVSNIIKTKPLVTIIYWDLSAVTAIYVGEERHGYIMSPDTHNYQHFAEGLRYFAGLGLNNINADGSGITTDA